MSGHSKWSTIKHKKEAQDSKKGKKFGQVSRMIRVAVKEGKSGDPSQNAQLRLAIEKAKAVNMPKANVDRAIQRGLGKSASGAVFEEVLYEGFGPAGVGLMVLAITDNRNRTAADIRSIFDRHSGSLGSPGSASYLFEMNKETQSYQVKVPMPVVDQQDVQRISSLIETLEEHDDVEMVVTNLAQE